jgi:hypothetical protein
MFELIPLYDDTMHLFINFSEITNCFFEVRENWLKNLFIFLKAIITLPLANVTSKFMSFIFSSCIKT